MIPTATSDAGRVDAAAGPTRLTMLAEMMGADLERAVEELARLDIRLLDLKNHVFGRAIEDLDDARRERLASLLERADASVYCFSAVLGHEDVGQVSEAAFRSRLERGIRNLTETAKWGRPAKVRLLACVLDPASPEDATERLDRRAPWVYAAYRDAIDQLADAGLAATIENEPDSVLASPAATVAFFERLGRPAAGLTWDVQNMWQAGTYPTVDAYRVMRPLIDYLHLKGGRAAPDDPQRLAFRAPLADADWPVAAVVSAAIADRVSPVICLNASHGAIAHDSELAHLAGTPALTRAEAVRDVNFLRSTFEEIA